MEGQEPQATEKATQMDERSRRETKAELRRQNGRDSVQSRQLRGAVDDLATLLHTSLGDQPLDSAPRRRLRVEFHQERQGSFNRKVTTHEI